MDMEVEFTNSVRIGEKSEHRAPHDQCEAETITTAPAFREAIKYRRCLVPADAFYEWQKLDAKRQPFAVAMKDGKPYALAGLWERWKDRSAGTELLTFTIITTDPNETVQPLHDRVPVIIPERDYERWLKPDPERPPIDLLRPFDAGGMTAWRVDKAVGDVKNDRPELIESASAAPEQIDDRPPETPGLLRPVELPAQLLHREHALVAVQFSFGLERYIHDLGALCDKSGNVQTIALLHDDRDALLHPVEELGQASEFLLSGCLVRLLCS